MTAAFTGFPIGLPTFLSGLEANNNKSWFDAHRSDYEEQFVTPARDFIATLEPLLQEFDPNLRAEAKLNKSLRRVFRDTRFAKDKTPYNPRMHLVFWEGDKPLRAPGFHLVIGSDTLGIGAGAWGLEGNSLERYRSAVSDLDNAEELREAIKTGTNQGGYELDKPTLKRLPTGLEVDSPHEDLFRQKALILRRDTPLPDDLFTRGALDYTIEQFRPLLPLHHWIMKHIFTD